MHALQRNLRLSMVAALAVVGLIGLVACDDSKETGRLRLSLTDAPYPIEMIASAEISIEAIRVHVDSDGEGWHDLPFTPKTFDLLMLQNGVTAELTDAELPVGRLDEVRLIVSSGEIVLTDGRNFPLTIPSGSSSGLKIKVRPPIVIAGGLTSDVLLDMDIARSFLSTPASPTRAEDIVSFKFKPVVRVANLTTSGSVHGYVYSDEGTPMRGDDLPILDATVLVHAGLDSSYAFTDSMGFYRVLGLSARTWTIEAEADSFLGAMTSVDVIVGNDVQADSLFLSPEPAKR